MKKLRGYIFSRKFDGQRTPQHIQNTILRQYCEKNNYFFLLSSTEYTMKNSDLMLMSIFNELEDIDGILFYSLFMLPNNYDKRNLIYKNILSKGKQLHFAVEDIIFEKDKDVKYIEKIIMIQKSLKDIYIKDIRNHI